MRTFIACVALLAAVAAPARAQEADSRWAPWLGCWQMVGERVREGNPSGAAAVAAARDRVAGATGDVEVCVAPASQPSAVTLTTRVADEPALEQTLVADGAPHTVTQAGCEGSERADWSRDGRRLFTSAELSCAGQPVRTISGLAMLTPAGAWLDVQAVDVAGRTNVRVHRYRRAGLAPYTGASLTVGDVKEASAKVAPAVLEAALIETQARFDLRSEVLVDLDEAGVADAVTDLMVALSFPGRFEVERSAGTGGLDLFPSSYGDAGWSPYWGLGYPYFSWYPGYYGNYRYDYSPFGYFGSALYGPYSSFYYPGAIIVTGGGIADPPEPDAGGRAVQGVGYTRIRAREATGAEAGEAEAGGSSRGRSTLRPSGYSQAGSDSSRTSGSSGGRSSNGGGGSGRSGGGRTAQPR